jgi:alpha-amylase
MVLVQGFDWRCSSTYVDGKSFYVRFAAAIPLLKECGVTAVWLPPCSDGAYSPRELFQFSNCYGTKLQLVGLIEALHEEGIAAIADVVINHRVGTDNWHEFTNPEWPTQTIVSNDPSFDSPHSSCYKLPMAKRGNRKPSKYEMWKSARNIDHSHPVVQRDIETLLKKLTDELGFDGFRFDMVKGYDPEHVKRYISSCPVFSVGEYWDGNRQAVTDWVDEAGQISAAFDFPLMYKLKNALREGQYEELLDGHNIYGLVSWLPAWAVTFIDNHDTASATWHGNGQDSNEVSQVDLILMGYAILLTHPGIPCIYGAHILENDQLRSHVRALVALRRDCGILSNATVYAKARNGRYYAAIVNDRVAVKIGPCWGWNAPQDYELKLSGNQFAVWVKPK